MLTVRVRSSYGSLRHQTSGRVTIGVVLNTSRLRIFRVVAQEGSFTAAAARLHYTQSAISQQMAILERELGVALMERRSRGIILTRAGTLLADRVHPLLSEIAALEHEVQRIAERPRSAHLGVFSTAGAHLVPLVVRRYQQRHPDVQLVVHSCPPEQLSAQLADGAIDAGLSWDYDYAPRAMAGLTCHHLLDDPLCLLLPPDHPLAEPGGPPLALADLEDQSWVSRTHRGLYTNAFEAMCRIAGFEPDVVFRTEDYASLQGLVAAGVGVAMAPRLSLIAQRPDVVIRPVHNPRFARRVQAVTLPGASHDPVAAPLVEVLMHSVSPATSGDDLSTTWWPSNS